MQFADHKDASHGVSRMQATRLPVEELRLNGQQLVNAEGHWFAGDSS